MYFVGIEFAQIFALYPVNIANNKNAKMRDICPKIAKNGIFEMDGHMRAQRGFDH
tara:strand:- start:5244 stop:5408 length:165 start_codon:yes stop_codon:yes gene_type:complete